MKKLLKIIDFYISQTKLLIVIILNDLLLF